MKTAYFDCFSGVAGDMILGALVDAGMPLAHLKRELGKLDIGSYRIARRRLRDGVRIDGTDLHVTVSKEIGDSRYVTIARRIERSRLTGKVKEMSLAIMKLLAGAEAKVHRVPLNRVHFHEVGAVDSIVDCVGAAIGFDYFGFDHIVASPLPITRGRIRCAHGLLPVPAPATLEIIKGIPLEPAPVKEEIVTPTGAAILASAVDGFGECPLQRIDSVGYGFGDKVFENIPNCLRLMIGEGAPVVVVEATVDDMNPQIFDYLLERLFEAGAVDVTLTSVQMKKNRPGTVISCLAPWHAKDSAIETILRETTTTGVRYFSVDRRVMTREMKTVSTRLGRVRVKVAKDEELGITKHIPEYDDMKKLAKKKKVPLLAVYRETMKKIKH